MVASDLSLDFNHKGSRGWQAAAERQQHVLRLGQAQGPCFKCTVSSKSYLNRQISRSLARRKKCRGRSSRSSHEWSLTCFTILPGFLDGSTVKNLPAKQEMSVRSWDQEDPLEKEMSLDSSILAWRNPWTEEPGGLQSMGLQKSQTWLSDWTTTASILPKSLSLFGHFLTHRKGIGRKLIGCSKDFYWSVVAQHTLTLGFGQAFKIHLSTRLWRRSQTERMW